MSTIQPPPELEPSSTARRRLLGGAFGVPAVLALHSGQAFAASNTCVANQLNGARTVPSVLGDATYARAPLFYVQSGNGKKRWYLSGSWFESVSEHLPGVVHNATGIGHGQFREVTMKGSSATVETENSDPKSVPVQSADKHLVIRFRAGADPKSIDIAGVFDSTTSVDGSAIAGSCWFSFEAATKKL